MLGLLRCAAIGGLAVAVGSCGDAAPAVTPSPDASAATDATPAADAAPRASCQIAQVSLGGDHSCALAVDGTAWCWGAFLRIGVCEPDNSPVPWRVELGQPVTALSAAEAHTCALLADTSIACWGWNGLNQTGSGDPAEWVRRPRPVVHDDGTRLTGVTQLAAGGGFGCAVAADRIWCWGRNAEGEFGNGGTAAAVHPVPGPNLRGVRRIAAGNSHACAIDADQALWCWGWNGTGQIGNGSQVDVLEPVVVATDVAEVELGMTHSCAIDRLHQVHCWGANDTGQLGDGTTTSRAVPAPVTPPPGGWTDPVALALGQHHACAVEADGRTFCWGADWLGALGRGIKSDDPVTTPALASALPATARDVSGGELHGCVALGDGHVRCMGVNDQGEVGSGVVSLGGVVTPVDVDLCGSDRLEPAECPP